jgi:coproporphyrinogen III oxidase
MTDLKIQRTDKTPAITATLDGTITIIGISIPENAMAFYEDLKKWVDEYSKSSNQKTVCNVFLDYFNTSTANIMLNFFKRLSLLRSDNHEVIINWYFEKNDIEMEESGNDYKSLLNIPFNLIEKEV